MRRLRIRNWADLQHYRTRRPPWIKLHRGLLDDYAWHRLPEASRAMGPMLWLLASEHADGVVPCRRRYKHHPPTDEQRWKRMVRAIARSRRARGKLRQKPCRHCGESRTELHHPDYTWPLYVLWLCRSCHLKLHDNKRRRARRPVNRARPGRRR